MSDYSGSNRRENGSDAGLLWISKQLESIEKRMTLSHEENFKWKEDHIRIDHTKTERWQDSHDGQGDDTHHAIIEKRLAAHSKRFWWLSGAGAAIGAGLTAFMEWIRK